MSNQKKNVLLGILFALFGLLLNFLIGITFLAADAADLPDDYISWIVPAMIIVFLLNTVLTCTAGATYITDSVSSFLIVIAIMIIASAVILVVGATAENFLTASRIEKIPFWINYTSVILLSLGYSFFLYRKRPLKNLLEAA